MKRLMITALIVLTSFSLSFSQEARKKGFVLGFGGGLGLTSFTQEVDIWGITIKGDRENKIGFQTDFKIGYAPTPQLQIYWTAKSSWFGLENALGDNVIILNGFGGAGISYYLKQQSPSFFLSGGLGYSSWGTPFEEGTEGSYGLGLFLGGGYEFSKHFCIEGNLKWGNPSEDILSTNAFTFLASAQLKLK